MQVLSVMGVIRPLTTAVMLAIAVISQPDVTNSPSPAPSLESLPTGEYYYESAAGGGRFSLSYVLLRKAGRTVIGLDGTSRTCFRGFIEQNQIVDATRAYPPYQPDSRWEHVDGTMIDLADYEQRNQRQPSVGDREMLQRCIQMFWR